MHRLHKIPMCKSCLDIELNKIQQMANNNGYNLIHRNNIDVKKTFRNKLQLVNPTHININFHSLTYIGEASEKLKTFIRN